MQKKNVFNLNIYIDEDYKKDHFSLMRLHCTPAVTHLLCQHMFTKYY